MSFNTLTFVLFFLIVWLLYLTLGRRNQNLLILVGSYVFYASWDYRFLSLILISTLCDYLTGLWIHRAQTPWNRRLGLAVSLCTNLGILGFFKYFNFFVSNANHLLTTLGLESLTWNLHIILPVGISFYTFQTMSYTLDVYRGTLKPTRNLLDFAAFVAYFPQLVAGPIERASNLLPQFESVRRITLTAVRQGCWLIAWGLFKKMVIADNLASIADPVFAWQVPLDFLSVVLGVYAFAFQIYCDFSGYSDIARGLAMLMGFHLMVNFNNPYRALNPAEFWKRWHISLSTWLRDYLYVSLGGNRQGLTRTCINLMLTMLLGGLWHGAAWTFVFWGLYQGGILTIHRLYVHWKQSPTSEVSRYSVWELAARRFVMFQFICIGWVLFRAVSMRQVLDLFKGLGHIAWPSATLAGWGMAFVILTLPLLVVQTLTERSRDEFAPLRLSFFPRAVLFALLCAGFLVLGNTGSQSFIYFQF